MSPHPVPGLGRVVMVVPTYDEALNLPPLVERLRAAQPDVDLLVVDDNSPDGTGAIADAIAAADPQVSVLHRTSKEGLGAAYLHGFRVALDRGYDVIGEMDADGSHQPEQLHRLLDGAARRRPGDRLALGPRRQHRQLAAAPPAALAWRQLLHPHAARDRRARRHCRLPPVPPYDARAARRSRRSPPWATSSRPTSRSGRCGPGCASSRCRSSSSSASAATRR